MRMSGLKAALSIAKKDIISQIRKKFEITSMFLFALIAVLVFSLALGRIQDATITDQVASGMVWVFIFFTGMFGFAPIFLAESESGTLRGLSVAPIPAWSVYIGKVIYGFVLMGIVEIFLLPIISVLFNISLFQYPLWTIGIFVIGTLDLAAVGSMASALTMPSESKATVFPLVYFPTATSGLILLVEMTRILVMGFATVTIGMEFLILQMLIAHLLGMLTLSAVVFSFALTQ
jgi:heme exporter protein B